MKLIPLKNGSEYDALTKAKRFHHFRAGVRQKIKRGFNKRFRRTERAAIREMLELINAN